jgi:nicotinamidase-related amidase
MHIQAFQASGIFHFFAYLYFMKEQYLSPENIDQVTHEMVTELTVRNFHLKPWKLQVDKVALLILDMQNYFLDTGSHAFTPSAPAIVPNINKLVDLANDHDMPVIFTRHVNDTENAGMMGRWWQDMVAEGSRESQIVGTIGNYEGKRGRGEKEKGGQGEWRIITKHQYDAFYGTDLEEYLRSKGIEQVIISGVLANLCCETTARSAFVRGFGVLFPVDATAAYNREFHIGTFRNLGFGFCPVITTSELITSPDKHE